MELVSIEQILEQQRGERLEYTKLPDIYKKFILRALDTIIKYHDDHYRAEYGQETNPHKDINIIPIVWLRAWLISDNMKHLDCVFQYTAMPDDPEVSGLVPKDPFVDIECDICGTSMRRQRAEVKGKVGPITCTHCHKHIHIDFSAMRW